MYKVPRTCSRNNLYRIYIDFGFRFFFSQIVLKHKGIDEKM